ncbi:MAG: hypothetical protein F4107_08625 [Gemmatimonadetes bacterium]|nr:hypothetical protein [Gemmatimonadota bacterium]MYD13960.1 hypothetical protein [Gemmatimonadota bacterium]MYI65981.1 hypothetical protein [Gemmatimonadota bacterium]
MEAGRTWLPMTLHRLEEAVDDAGGRRAVRGPAIPCNGSLARESGTLVETDARLTGVTTTRYEIVRHGGLEFLLGATPGKYVLVDHDSIQRRIVSVTEPPVPWGRYLQLEVEGEGQRVPAPGGYILDYGQDLFLTWHGAQLFYGA